MAFPGFNPAALALLPSLPKFDPAQYAEQKDLLSSGLFKPGAALIQDVAGVLDAGLTVIPRGSVSPLHTDLRFAAPGSPRYKDHLLLTAWAGPDKKTAPTLWIRIAGDSAGFASGAMFTPETRSRWRQAVAGPRGEALSRAIEAVFKAHSRHGVEVAGDQLKRTPSPWSDDHPRADLLRRNCFQIRFGEPMPKKLLTQPGLTGWCVERLRDLLPVHQWLAAELGAGGTRKK
ncbi:MAG: hypothetical protein GMKNLPBB_00966 [Myxococcota bacterium]|nr:hypothetical protein [Myxococcota bacterium]